jgi:hypothetical protein
MLNAAQKQDDEGGDSKDQPQYEKVPLRPSTLPALRCPSRYLSTPPRLVCGLTYPCLAAVLVT